jgi:two-component system, LytTR family, response regulator
MKNQEISVGSYKKFRPQEIIYLKGEVNYSYIYLISGERLLVCTTLKTLENRFKNAGFFRAHKSSLINLDFIKNYIYDVNGGKIELLNNETIEVSRRKNRILKTLLIVNP